MTLPQKYTEHISNVAFYLLTVISLFLFWREGGLTKVRKPVSQMLKGLTPIISLLKVISL